MPAYRLKHFGSQLAHWARVIATGSAVVCTSWGAAGVVAFVPFFTTSKTGMRMGMGMPISRAIVEARGDRLRVIPSGDHRASFGYSPPVSRTHPFRGWR